MGMFDDLKDKARGMVGESGGEGSRLLTGIMEMLSEGGGLGGLVQSFQQKGLGNIISSWIGTGQNSPISPDQIKEGVGSEKIQDLAAKTGIPPEEVTAKLSEHLPNVIDNLTPDGVIPEKGMLDKGLEFLKSKF